MFTFFPSFGLALIMTKNEYFAELCHVKKIKEYQPRKLNFFSLGSCLKRKLHGDSDFSKYNRGFYERKRGFLKSDNFHVASILIFVSQTVTLLVTHLQT